MQHIRHEAREATEPLSSGGVAADQPTSAESDEGYRSCEIVRIQRRPRCKSTLLYAPREIIVFTDVHQSTWFRVRATSVTRTPLQGLGALRPRGVTFARAFRVNNTFVMLRNLFLPQDRF